MILRSTDQTPLAPPHEVLQPDDRRAFVQVATEENALETPGVRGVAFNRRSAALQTPRLP